MRHFIAPLIAMLLVATPASGVLYPSDNLSGGGPNNIPFTMHFGGASSTWPTTVICLRSTGSGSYISCADGEFDDERILTPYSGQVFVRQLACAPADDFTIWDGTGTPSISLSVYETQGGSGTLAYSRNQIGGALTFLKTDEPGVTKTLTINAFTTIENGMIQVKPSAVVEAGGAPVAQVNGFTCIISGYE